MSELTNIRGIGPATVAKLNELGIHSLSDLASQDDPAALAELVGGRGVTAEIVGGWIALAKGGIDGDGGGSNANTGPLEGDHGGGGEAGAAMALIPVKVLRDFWDKNGGRHRKGTVVEVSINEALDGVESGSLSRVKG